MNLAREIRKEASVAGKSLGGEEGKEGRWQGQTLRSRGLYGISIVVSQHYPRPSGS